MTLLELLAPARNADIGIAAIRCGADAVYIGGPAFGARAAAGNSIGDIRRLCDVAARFGARIYVTVNTLAANQEEREEAAGMMLSMKGCGISAFILQDTSLLPLLRDEGPWEEDFHASTQCAIRTVQRAVELSGMGFSRLILERQLSLEEIRAIRRAVPSEVELECFVHGALCMCYSGDCYLSEYLTGRSANRGECAQPCRSRYDLVDADGKIVVKNRPLLSLKDLELRDRLEDLAEAGAVSFKIEGRLKNESYVKNVVRAYSQALDSLTAGSDGRYCRSSFGTASGGFTPDPDKTFNRGYTSLYLDGKRSGWNSSEAAGGLGEYLGTVTCEGRNTKANCAPAPSVFVLRTEEGRTVHNGDGLCLTDRKGEIQGFRVETARVLPGGTASLVEIRTREGCKVSPGSRIWRNRDIEFEKSLEKNPPQRLIRARMDLEFSPGKMKIKATREDGCSISAEYDTGPFPPADNRERMLSMLHTQLERRSGDLEFSTADVQIPEGGVLPLLSASFLNSTRRSLAERLAAEAVLPRQKDGLQHSGKQQEDKIDGENLKHPRRKAELMRSRYCIRAELGICLKEKSVMERRELFLRNGPVLLPLLFDCRNCEMVVMAPEKQ